MPRGDEKPVVNGPVLREIRLARGYMTPAALSHALGDDISDDTIARWEKSPDVKRSPNLNLLSAVADFLEVPVETLIYLEGPLPPKQRSFAGVWRVRGDDIEVGGHIEYPNGPKFVEAEVVVKDRGDAIVAEGRDHDRDPLSFFGYSREGGNFFVGTYTVANERLHAYGTVHLQYESCGNRMTGFYLGRDTGHGSTFILGRMTMERVKE